MNVAFGWPLTLAGTLALAAIVYGLQHLRVRRRILRLPTAGLWAEAMRDAPARVLGGRFRFWATFALILGIALLLWTAAAQPQVGPAAGAGRQIFYLDNSALLLPDGDLAAAKRALIADVRATAPDRREVVLGDAVATRLLVPGENVSLLARRLDLVRAQARPSRFATWLPDAGAPVRYYGAWPAAKVAAPAGRSVTYGYLTDPVPGNRGIVALGATPAASGRWSAADVLVGVASADGSEPDDLRWTLDGEAVDPARVRSLGGGRYLLPDVAAAGQMVTVALSASDGFPADDSARLRLPDRRPLRVALLAGTPASVATSVAADDSLAVVPLAQAQVVVGSPAATAATALPALVLTDPAAQDQAFVFAGPGEGARDDLAARLDELGLREADAAALADALRRPIGVTLRDATARRVGVWGAVFASGSSFADSAAMPLLLSRSLHWLGGAPAWQSHDPDALTDRATTLAVADGSARPAITPMGSTVPNLPVVALLLAALLLLGGEWWLVQRGRIA